MIGVFDSGLGGLSVVREVMRMEPEAGILYLGDRAWAPYGGRTLEELRSRAEQVTDHLLAEGASTIAIACNTASAAALHHLRTRHPDVAFVGMEPAVKPAACLTRSGVIGVLATPATFQGELYASVVDRFARDLVVVDSPCPGWVELVESDVPEAEVADVVERALRPVLDAGADVLVLACTHYPFLRRDIERIGGPGVSVLDPGEAVARQVVRTATTAAGIAAGGLTVQVTGPAGGVADRIRRLTGLAPPVRTVTLPHRVH